MGSLRVALRAGEGCQERLPCGTGRLLAGVAWLVLLLGLWLWGGPAPAGEPAGPTGPVTGDMAAAGRPPRAEPSSPKPHATAPRLLAIPALGVRAPVVARGLDENGTLEPPPAGQPDAVAWYADGVAPGAAGTALMAGTAGTGAGLAVGQEIRVVRADGETVGFTVEDVRAVTRDGSVVRDGRLDVRQVSVPDGDGRAGLRLITCGGTADRTSGAGACTAPVVVSAYATGA